MDTAFKFVELFSHNWIILIISLFVVAPLVKLAIKSYVDLKIAKINSKNTVVLHFEENGCKKSLEISATELNLSELKNNTLFLESSRKETA